MKKLKFLTIGVLFITCQSGFLYTQNYNLKSPKGVFKLPPLLREVSGICVTENKEVVCVQDELGLLFRYNTEKKDVVEKDSFYVRGDFEGIASVGNNLYVLRSDGAIIEVTNPFTNNLTTNTYNPVIPASDMEGLCYDEINNRLLVACKSDIWGEGASANRRKIYEFDLKEKKFNKDWVIDIDIPTIHSFLTENYKVSSSSDIHFNPSEVAIHPISGKLYVLSADANLLCVFNNGVFESAEILDKSLFYKAEGLSFFENGDMLISNEGPRGETGNILLFKYKK